MSDTSPISEEELQALMRLERRIGKSQILDATFKYKKIQFKLSKTTNRTDKQIRDFILYRSDAEKHEFLHGTKQFPKNFS